MARPRRPQQGLSLVGVMVGLMISIVAALAVLTLYRSLVARAVEGTQRANQDGYIASATLTAQMELQGAGYGIGSAAAPALANTDLLVLASAALDGSNRLTGSVQTVPASGVASGNAIVWGSNPSLAAYECNALIVQNAGLKLLRASCTVATQWATPVWQTVSELAPAGGLAVTGTLLRAERAACWPYGQSGADAQALKVTFWDDASPWKSSVCLPAVNGPST